MTTKKNDNLTPLLIFAGFLLFIPFLFFTFLHYRKLKKMYPKTDDSQRIFDFGNLIPAIIPGAISLAIGAYLIAQSNQFWGSLIFIAITWLGYNFAKSIAVTYYGVIVNSKNDTILLPKDMANYGIEDYMKLKFIRELGTMDVVNLSSITKITKQAGKKLFIHGSFGSRGVEFSSKQKRDECIAAIENAENFN